jgi:hypothetical protein
MSQSVTTPQVYYVVVDSAGLIAQYGVTSASMWPALQQAVQATQVTQQQYNQIASGGSWMMRGTTLILLPASVAPIAEAQTAAAAIVDNQAEQTRLQFITPGFGQMLVYQQKAFEAQAFMTAYPTDAAYTAANPAPTAAQYPLLFDEVGITAPDAWGVAQVIMTAQAQWLGLAAVIERMRLLAKQQIAAATTQQQISAAMNIPWPTPASVAAAAAAAIPITGNLNQTALAT